MGNTALIVRPSNPTDFDQIAEILNERFGTARPVTGKSVQIWDERRNPETFLKRWVASEGSQIIGQALLNQDRVFFHPRQFTISVAVRRSKERQGIGTALFEAATADLSDRPVDSIKSSTNEECEAGIQFLRKRGFNEKYRLSQSLMSLSDRLPFQPEGLSSNLKNAGIEILPLNTVRARFPNYQAQIFELIREVDRDIPLPDDFAPQSLERFWQTIDRELPEGEPFFVAMKEGEFIATHFSRLSADKKQLQVCQTGVRRDVRHLGLATALKLRGIEFAQNVGIESISTWSDSRNKPMLALNQKLGFRRLPATLIMQKICQPTPSYGAASDY